MTWWASLVLAVVASGCVGGLMGAWAAERRLDRRLVRELYHPLIRNQVAQDRGEVTSG